VTALVEPAHLYILTIISLRMLFAFDGFERLPVQYERQAVFLAFIFCKLCRTIRIALAGSIGIAESDDQVVDHCHSLWSNDSAV